MKGFLAHKCRAWTAAGQHTSELDALIGRTRKYLAILVFFFFFSLVIGCFIIIIIIIIIA